MTQPQRGAPAPQQTQTQALVQAPAGPLAVKWNMNVEQLDLLKRTVAKGTTDDEFALFMTVASRLGLDPFLKQIHAVKRRDSDSDAERMTIQIGIDGYRLGAARTGEDDGQDGPYWCGTDKVWHDVWIDDTVPPVAAKVMVYRKGRTRPYVGVALWASYAQYTRKGELNSMWRKHGPGQLAKCAESLALRKAFPAELAGTHTDDELGADGADAIDAEFTELRPIAANASPPAAAGPPAAGAAPSPSSVPASQAGPAAAPASSAKPAGPPPGVPHPPPTLTEDDVIEIIEEISRCETAAACKVVHHNRIARATMTEAQRERLGRAYEGQLDEIKARAAAAKGPA